MSKTSAYILMEALPGQVMELFSAVKKIEGIKMVHLVTGPYDVVAFAEADDLKALGELIIKKIQASGNAAKTLTCVIVEV